MSHSLWSEGVDKASDGFPEPLDGSLRRLAQQGLQLCEGHLDRIEIGTVGGRNLSRAPFASRISRTEARLWLERLSMITVSPGRRVGARIRATQASNRSPLDWTVEPHRGAHAFKAQPGEERSGFPVALRNAPAPPRAPRP